MNSSAPNERAAPTAPAPNESTPDAPPTSERCPNCDAALTSAYCGECGQRATNRIVPLWQVSNEFLEDLFDLDLRVLRTFPTFFFRPGRLTTEYLRGRRRRYIRPLRLYLFSSFLLFTVLALTELNGFSFSFEPSPAEAQAGVEEVRAELDSLRASLAVGIQQGARTSSPAAPTPGEADSTAGLDRDAMQDLDAAIAALEPLAAEREPHEAAVSALFLGESANEMTEAGVPPSVQAKVLRLVHEPKAIVRDMVDRAPYLMFLLVPTFALLLKLLYVRRKRLYLEHLVFALHVHALAFIVFAMSAGMGALDLGTSVHLDRWLAAAPFGYLFVAMRHVYGQSMAVTAVKLLGLLLAYGIILVGAVVFLAVMTVAFM